MPDNKVFRPERRPITQEDLGVNESMSQESVEAIPENLPPRMDAIQEMQESGMVQGQIPPQLLAQMAQMTQQMTGKPAPDKRGKFKQKTHTASKNSDLLSGVLARVKSFAKFEEIVLPSQGKFYDGSDGPSDGRVRIRPMTGHEEEILATDRFVRKGQAINKILNSCMDEQWNSENLLTTDRIYLLIYIRGISYPGNYDAEIECQACEKPFSASINLDKLEYEDCPDDFGPESLHGTLPITSLEFKYRLPRISDDKKTSEYREKMVKEFDVSGRPDDSSLYRLALLVEELGLSDGQRLTDHGAIMQVLRELPMNDLNHLRNLINDLPFGVDTKIKVICDHCGKEFETLLPLEANFFFPKTKKDPTS